jgi:uncharacterized membrane protein YphA (DoxX/SURF4 family)
MMEKITSVVHWLCYSYYLYLFGYAGLFKVLQKPKMMTSMLSLGFDKTWTIWIGIAETIGVIALLIGVWNHQIKNAAVLFLFPFAVGALIAHFAHSEYKHFYNALIACVLSLCLLITEKHFKLFL